jgi:hypothetical protein
MRIYIRGLGQLMLILSETAHSHFQFNNTAEWSPCLQQYLYLGRLSYLRYAIQLDQQANSSGHLQRRSSPYQTGRTAPNGSAITILDGIGLPLNAATMNSVDGHIQFALPY